MRKLNPHDPVTLYPGSPRLIAERLRSGDSYVGAELQEEDFGLLQQALAPFQSVAKAMRTDGYGLAAEAVRRDGRLFVLVDPPFERGDDYQRTADLARDLVRRNRRTVAAIWTPLKDLETFDAFVRRLESLVDVSILAAELRLKPLDNPMRLNGCAMIFLNPPKDLADALKPALDWIAGCAGEPGAEVRMWITGP